MAKKRFGGDFSFKKQRSVSYDCEERDCAVIAEMIKSTKQFNDEGYRTLFKVTEYARIHGRNVRIVEEGIEKLLERGYAEISEGRFVKLTKKGNKIIEEIL